MTLAFFILPAIIGLGVVGMILSYLDIINVKKKYLTKKLIKLNEKLKNMDAEISLLKSEEDLKELLNI